MTPEQLDEWRWSMAIGVAEAPRVSGFDPRKDRLTLDWLGRVTEEYRRLVIEGAQPVASGKLEP